MTGLLYFPGWHPIFLEPHTPALLISIFFSYFRLCVLDARCLFLRAQNSLPRGNTSLPFLCIFVCSKCLTDPALRGRFTCICCSISIVCTHLRVSEYHQTPYCRFLVVVAHTKILNVCTCMGACSPEARVPCAAAAAATTAIPRKHPSHPRSLIPLLFSHRR